MRSANNFTILHKLLARREIPLAGLAAGAAGMLLPETQPLAAEAGLKVLDGSHGQTQTSGKSFGLVDAITSQVEQRSKRLAIESSLESGFGAVELLRGFLVCQDLSRVGPWIRNQSDRADQRTVHVGDPGKVVRVGDDKILFEMVQTRDVFQDMTPDLPKEPHGLRGLSYR